MSECVGGLRLFRLAECLIVLLVAAPFLSAQNVINVPTNQPTIQAGINAANSGDTVLVAPGTYVENINFVGKAITVTSSGGPSVTTIDGGAKGSVVTFDTGETASSKLSGFTVTNGFQNGLAGGGISISGASPTITGNVITGNHAAVGIGIYVNGGSPLIQNNTITANDQKGAGGGGGGGGGILVSGDSTTPANPQIIGNTITNNSTAIGGGGGGGISIDYFSSPLVQGNRIQGNAAYNDGGGISVDSYNSPIIVQNVIINNSVVGDYSGGGMWVSVDNSPENFTNNTIAANTTAYNRTSGIYVTGFAQNATFTNNVVVATAGQAAATCDSSYSSISPVLSYNDAFSSSGQSWSGICDTTSRPGNISADPLFIDAAADFHIQWGSPAVDAGNNSAPNLPATDFDGNPRVVDGNGDGIATVDLGAYELSPTTITLVPSSLTFGPQPLGTTSASQAVNLTNTGNQKLLFVMSASANFAETDHCGSSLAAGTSCTINVSFSPTATGNITGNVTLKDTASGNPHTVALAGTGGAPVASLNPTSLNFGAQPVGTTSAAQTITLSNAGNDAMAISSITSSGDFAETNTCGATLPAGANCSINVTFMPTATGARSGGVSVTDNASGSPHSTSLMGSGTAPSATLSPANLTFGGQLVVTTSAVQSTTLTNTGNARLTISAISVTGDFAETNTCGTTLPAGANCSINVTFTPTAVGTRSGSVTVTDNASDNPQNVLLAGTGTAPMATLSPATLTFGSLVIGTTSPTQSATLSNTGTAPLTISGITIAGDFAQTNNCGNSIAPGVSCAINVSFTPSAVGSRSGTLVVSDNSNPSPQNLGLSGTGVDFGISVTPSSTTVPRGGSSRFSVSVAPWAERSLTPSGSLARGFQPLPLAPFRP